MSKNNTNFLYYSYLFIVQKIHCHIPHLNCIVTAQAGNIKTKGLN